MDFQGVMLDLIENSSFNSFNGKAVRADLEKYRNLWQSCMITRAHPGITLRDLPDGYYNVDTLYILAAPDRSRELLKVVSHWKADEVKVIIGKDAEDMLGQYGQGNPVIIELWWD